MLLELTAKLVQLRALHEQVVLSVQPVHKVPEVTHLQVHLLADSKHLAVLKLSAVAGAGEVLELGNVDLGLLRNRQCADVIRIDRSALLLSGSSDRFHLRTKGVLEAAFKKTLLHQVDNVLGVLACDNGAECALGSCLAHSDDRVEHTACDGELTRLSTVLAKGQVEDL